MNNKIGNGSSIQSNTNTIIDNQGVPDQNETDNILARDVVGNKTDNGLLVPGQGSLYGIAGYMGYYHVHSSSLVYPRDAAPKTLTAGVGAYVEGTKVELIPVSTIDKFFDIHWSILGEISAIDDYVLKIYTGASGSEVFWGECAFSRDSNQQRGSNVPIQGPPIPANTRISGSLMSGLGSNNVKVKIYIHEYGA